MDMEENEKNQQAPCKLRAKRKKNKVMNDGEKKRDRTEPSSLGYTSPIQPHPLSKLTQGRVTLLRKAPTASLFYSCPFAPKQMCTSSLQKKPSDTAKNRNNWKQIKL